MTPRRLSPAQDVKPEVFSALMDFFQSDQPVMLDETPPPAVRAWQMRRARGLWVLCASLLSRPSHPATNPALSQDTDIHEDDDDVVALIKVGRPFSH